MQSKLQKQIQDKLSNERSISNLVSDELAKNKKDVLDIKEKLIKKAQVAVKTDQLKLYNDDIQLIISRLQSDNKIQEALIKQLQ